MKIVIDADDVLLDSMPTARKMVKEIYPDADIPETGYASYWPVWGSIGSEEARLKFMSAVNEFLHSEHFGKNPAVPGAIEGVKALRAAGHELYVLTAVGKEPEIIAKRRQNIENIFGTDVFTDFIGEDRTTPNKGDVMKKIGATVLIDDGLGHISSALNAGLHGILYKFHGNEKIIDAVMSGSPLPHKLWWTSDTDIIRDKAIVANNWPEVVAAVEKINNG